MSTLTKRKSNKGLKYLCSITQPQGNSIIEYRSQCIKTGSVLYVVLLYFCILMEGYNREQIQNSRCNLQEKKKNCRYNMKTTKTKRNLIQKPKLENQERPISI